MRLEEGQDPIVEQVGGDQGVLPVVESRRGDLGVGVDEGLLVDTSDAFEGADMEGILRAQVARMLGFDLPVGLFLVLGLLQGKDLPFGEDQAILSDFGFQGFQTPFEGLEVMAQPDAADSARGDEKTSLA